MPRMNGATAASGDMSMNVIFDVTSNTADDMLDKLAMALGPAALAGFLAGPVVEHFQDRFSRFFEQQGADSGAWTPLSEVTIADRVEHGFGAGPINDRTGELKRYVTDSPGDVRVLDALAVLTYPGNANGELGKKVKTAQQGGTYGGHAVPARPVMEVNESDLLYIMSALNFFLEMAV